MTAWRIARSQSVNQGGPSRRLSYGSWPDTTARVGPFENAHLALTWIALGLTETLAIYDFHSRHQGASAYSDVRWLLSDDVLQQDRIHPTAQGPGGERVAEQVQV